MSGGLGNLVADRVEFIGSDLLLHLTALDYEVVGADSHSHHLCVEPKSLRSNASGLFHISSLVDVRNKVAFQKIIRNLRTNIVINLANRGGFWSSGSDPLPYPETSQVRFINLFDVFINNYVNKFIWANRSSVYINSLSAHFSKSDTLGGTKNLYIIESVEDLQISFLREWFN